MDYPTRRCLVGGGQHWAIAAAETMVPESVLVTLAGVAGYATTITPI